MNARFEVYRDRAGNWRFRLLDESTGGVLAISESYTRKHGAKRGAQAVRRAADGAQIVDLTEESS